MSLPPRRFAFLLLAATLGGFLLLTSSGVVLALQGTSPAPDCGCAVGSVSHPFPWNTIGLLVAAASGAILTAGAGVAGFASRQESRKIRGIRLARRTLEGRRVSIVPGNEPRAFCVGGWRPEVVVTVAFLRLDPTERSAILAHEAEHRRYCDPLALSFLGAIARILPPLRPIAVEFRRSVEFAADDAARLRAGDNAFGAALAAAIEPAPGFSVGFSPTEARIRRFLGEPHHTSRVPLAATAIGFVIGLSALFGGFRFGHRAEARVDGTMCRAERIRCERLLTPHVPVACTSTPGGTVCLVP